MNNHKCSFTLLSVPSMPVTLSLCCYFQWCGDPWAAWWLLLGQSHEITPSTSCGAGVDVFTVTVKWELGDLGELQQTACTFIVFLINLFGNWSKLSLNCNCSSEYWNNGDLRVEQLGFWNYQWGWKSKEDNILFFATIDHLMSWLH